MSKQSDAPQVPADSSFASWQPPDANNGENDDDNGNTYEHPLQTWLLAVNHILTDPPFDEPSQLPVEIVPWLYLSSHAPIVHERRRLQDELQITHVMSVNAMPRQETNRLRTALKGFGMAHTSIPGLDVEGYDLLGKHWVTARDVLQQVRPQNSGKVVVHCAAGQNRSGLIVAAALVELEGWSLLRTVRHLKAQRGIVLTNLSFQRQLCELAGRLGRLVDGDKDNDA